MNQNPKPPIDTHTTMMTSKLVRISSKTKTATALLHPPNSKGCIPADKPLKSLTLAKIFRLKVV